MKRIYFVWWLLGLGLAACGGGGGGSGEMAAPVDANDPNAVTEALTGNISFDGVVATKEPGDLPEPSEDDLRPFIDKLTASLPASSGEMLSTSFEVQSPIDGTLNAIFAKVAGADQRFSLQVDTPLKASRPIGLGLNIPLNLSDGVICIDIAVAVDFRTSVPERLCVEVGDDGPDVTPSPTPSPTPLPIPSPSPSPTATPTPGVAPLLSRALDTPNLISSAVRETKAIDGIVYATGQRDLDVVDIRDPSNPLVLSETSVGTISGMAIDSGRLFIDNAGKVAIREAADPAVPMLRGSSNRLDRGCLTRGSKTIDASGDFVFVVAEGPENVEPIGLNLWFLDLHDEQNLQLEQALVTPYLSDSPSAVCAIAGLRVLNGVAFIGLKEHPTFPAVLTTHIVDVNEPRNARLLSTLSGVGGVQPAVGSEVMFVENLGGLAAYNVSDPSSPQLINERVYTPPDGFEIRDLELKNGLLYVLTDDASSTLMSVLSPRGVQPAEILGSIAFSQLNRSYDVEIAEGVALISADSEGLYLVDISTPTAPSQLSTVGTSPVTTGLAVVGDRAYLAVTGGESRGELLQVVDISNPTDLRRTGFVGLSDGLLVDSLAIDVSGALAVVVIGNGLIALDIGQPDQPRFLGRSSSVGFGSLGFTVSARINGSLAYVLENRDGLRIFSLVDPNSPEEIGRVEVTNSGNGMAIFSDTVLLPGELNGVQIVDIQAPENPRLVGDFELPDVTLALHQQADIVYVWASERLHALDASNPTQPIELGSTAIPAPVRPIGNPIGRQEIRERGMSIDAGVLYLLDFNKLTAVDISNPAAPVTIGSLEVPVRDREIQLFVRDGVAFIAAGLDYFVSVDIRALSN